MKQYQAVIQIIEELGWLATLWLINHNIFNIKNCDWSWTKNPFANIRRIVQENKDIYKIKPWLYWLVKYKTQNDNNGFIQETEKNKDSKELIDFNHYYYQWLLVEIGNLEKFETYVPSQDQNKFFIDKKLWEIITLQKMYEFWYTDLIRRAKTIDVIYFNERKMPSKLYEVEHSTDIQNSLLKFEWLQDFNTEFFIVADKVRKNDYELKLSQTAFNFIRNRIKFLDYDKLSEIHSSTYKYYSSKNY
jgi:hypothetical protein